MNLLTEYSRRHSTEFALPVGDGVCFFTGTHPIVCVTSHSPKTITKCPSCIKSFVTFELFVPGSGGGYLQTKHYHLPPDADVFRHVKYYDNSAKPVYLKNAGDMERWLWKKFFITNSKLSTSRAWREFTESRETTDDMRTNEEMTWCAMNHPNHFSYYHAIHQVLVVGRKYLLYE